MTAWAPSPRHRLVLERSGPKRSCSCAVPRRNAAIPRHGSGSLARRGAEGKRKRAKDAINRGRDQPTVCVHGRTGLRLGAARSLQRGSLRGTHGFATDGGLLDFLSVRGRDPLGGKRAREPLERHQLEEGS